MRNCKGLNIVAVNFIPLVGAIILVDRLRKKFLFVDKTDYFVIVVSALSLYTVLFLIIRFLSKENSIEYCSDKIFIFLVMGLLITPVVRINFADRDLEENRMLKAFPVYEGIFNGKVSYFKELEAWFGDRFNFRPQLINYAYRLDAFVNMEHVSDKAFMAKNKWIFTKERNSIGNFQKTNRYTQEEINILKDNIANRQEWLAKQNIKYYLMIAPDKNSIYGEYYPDTIKVLGRENCIDQTYNVIKNELRIPIIYPVQILLDHKDRGLLYYKHDSHWTNYGAYFGYSSLIDELNKNGWELPKVEEKTLWIEKKEMFNGDLLGQLQIKADDYDKIQYPIVNNQNLKFKADIKYQGNRHIMKYTSGINSLKVIMFRDSFAGGMLEYLSQSFGTIYFIADNHRFNNYQKFIVEIKPDLIIHEVVGKYVGDLLINTPKLKEVSSFDI